MQDEEIDDNEVIRSMSDKKCAICGRTNCEGDPGCTIAAESRA